MASGLVSVLKDAKNVFLLLFMCMSMVTFSTTIASSRDTTLQDQGGKTETEDSPKDATSADTSENESAKVEDAPTAGTISPEILYLHLFKQKRASQKDAVNSVLAMGDYQKQYKMIQLLLDKIFKVITQARVALMEGGFIPGDPFPTNESTRDAFSNIVENMAFFGDILLRLPDITHDILNRNNEGLLTVRWGVGFCNDTSVFQGPEGTLLSLVAQELGIVERDPDYVNPYKQNTDKVRQKLEEEAFGKDFKEKKEKKEKMKKKKDKKKKGPRLSGASHTEL